MWTGQTWAQVYPGFFLSKSDSQLDQNIFEGKYFVFFVNGKIRQMLQIKNFIIKVIYPSKGISL